MTGDWTLGWDGRGGEGKGGFFLTQICVRSGDK